MPEPVDVSAPLLKPVLFRDLKGWSEDDLVTAHEAFRRSAQLMLQVHGMSQRQPYFAGTSQDWKPAFEAAITATDARRFFETHFQPFAVEDTQRPEGLFTGYFEPEVIGSRQKSDAFPVPVYRKPADLVMFSDDEERDTGFRYGRKIDGKASPYLLRKDIEQGALAGQGLEICWLNDWVDAFFMHIQGSGRVILKEGGIIRLSYAAKSGHPYTGVGSVLADRGVLTRQTMSMQTVKAWMKDHPEAARELMWLNKSYIFFRETPVEDCSLGAIGAAKVNLTPQRSLAVDRSYWAYATPMWINTTYPPESHKQPHEIARLMIAQDTGSAIKGAVRGDFYWGWGDDASLIAGHMKSTGSMCVLLPKPLAARLV